MIIYKLSYRSPSKKILDKIIYIGTTRRSIKTRLNEHISKAKSGDKSLLSKYIRSKNYKNFYIQLIRKIEADEDIKSIERKYIDIYGTLEPYGCNKIKNADKVKPTSTKKKPKLRTK